MPMVQNPIIAKGPKMLIFDRYDRPARLYPAMLVVLPALILFATLFAPNASITGAVESIAVLCGVSFAMTRVARDAGKRVELKLFKEWGGVPSTQILRHRDTRLNSHTKATYHTFLSSKIGRPMPSPESESNNPIAADELYAAATDWLRTQTRDTTQFGLLFRENIAYGFQRNALGLRWIGVGVALLSLIVALLKVGILGGMPPYLDVARFGMLDSSAWFTIASSGLMLLSWFFFFTKGAAERTAFAYAERLMEACDTLNTASPAAS